ncbi:response regulator [Candidatus Reidiella endopervernicosa]
MLVEDEPDIQAVAQLALEAVGGFTVEVCNSGGEALDRVAEEIPDLILCDVMMPGMDGPEMLSNLRSNPDYSTIPFIFMTAKVQPHEVAQYKEMGAIDVIAKPFDPMTLAEHVREIWSRDH